MTPLTLLVITFSLISITMIILGMRNCDVKRMDRYFCLSLISQVFSSVLLIYSIPYSVYIWIDKNAPVQGEIVYYSYVGMITIGLFSLWVFLPAFLGSSIRAISQLYSSLKETYCAK